MITIATVAQFADSLEHVAGFLFVLFVLAVLWVVLIISGSIFVRLKNRNTTKTTAPTSVIAPAVALAASDDLPEEDLVLIAAAVSIMLGRRPHRLISIRPPVMDWGREGRRQHLMSHKLH